jgi:hypothetical protein
VKLCGAAAEVLGGVAAGGVEDGEAAVGFPFPQAARRSTPRRPARQ